MAFDEMVERQSGGRQRRAAPDGDTTFAFRSGRASDLVSFYLKTSGGGGGTNFGPVFLDDIYLELSDRLNLTNPVAGFSGSPGGGLTLAADTTTLSWSALDGALTYDVVRGDLGQLRSSLGDFSAAVALCLADELSDTSVPDPESPPDGDGFFYLVRGSKLAGEPGTYDSASSGQLASRDPGVEASPAACP